MKQTHIKFFIALIVLTIILLGVNLYVFSYKFKTDEYSKSGLENNYKVYSLNLPTKMNFSGEAVPLNQFDVRESLDRELLLNTYWQSQSILLHKRAHRWFQKIVPILKQQGIPEDFKYLALIESGFTNVVSPAGATGFWQLIEKTATKYGLTITENIDERYHVEKSTLAACKYIKEAYRKFGNWTLAAASYNIGMTGLSNQMETQQENDYYNLLLNQETARYIYRILALKEILESPQKYGFNIRKKDLYPQIPDKIVRIDSSITNLAAFAKKMGSNYKILKLMNPWLRQNFFENKDNKTIEILFPSQNYDEIMLTEIYEGNPSYRLKNDSLGFILSIASDSTFSTH